MAKFLRKLSDGSVYGWAPGIAKRVDMVECDKDGNRTGVDLPKNVEELNTTEMEINGKKFDIPEYLLETVQELLEAAIGRDVSDLESLLAGAKDEIIKALADNNVLAKKNIDLTSSNGDLQKQLSDFVTGATELKKSIEGLTEDNTGYRADIKRLKTEVTKLKK